MAFYSRRLPQIGVGPGKGNFYPQGLLHDGHPLGIACPVIAVGVVPTTGEFGSGEGPASFRTAR